MENNFQGQVFNRNMMKTDCFFKVPQTLVYSERYQNLSEGAMIVYGFYRDRFDLSEKNNWVDENGDIYFLLSDAEIAYRLGRTEPTIRKKINELIDHGLIKRVKRAGATAKTYLYTVDGTARERGFLTKSRLIELLNLMFAKMNAQQITIKASELEETFINFIVTQEPKVNELEVRQLFKLHRFDALYRIADNHILSLSSDLLKKVKYLNKTTKEKSQKRLEMKKDFKNSFSEIFKFLSKTSHSTIQDFIFECEKLWLEQNENIISELEEAEKNEIQKNFVSGKFEEKNGIQKNFVSGNKETLYADTKNLFASQTDFSQTDSIDDDEKNNKGIPESKNEISQQVENFCEQELSLHDSLKTIDAFNLNIIKTGLENFYWEIGAKKTKQYFKHALDYTLENLVDISYFGSYLIQNMELQSKRASISRDVAQTEEARSVSFYIPMDGPWS